MVHRVVISVVERNKTREGNKDGRRACEQLVKKALLEGDVQANLMREGVSGVCVSEGGHASPSAWP